MSKYIKWKKAVYLAVAAGIVGLSGYGIHNIASAYNDFSQSQITDNIIMEDLPSGSSSLASGSICSPYGCAGCPGCVNIQYQQNVETLPGFTTQIEQID